MTIRSLKLTGLARTIVVELFPDNDKPLVLRIGPAAPRGKD